MEGSKPDYLPQTGCCYRLPLEVLKNGVHVAFQVRLDDCHSVPRVKGRHRILQLLQLPDELWGQHIHPRGELLANLDEGWAQLDQAFPEPNG